MKRIKRSPERFEVLDLFARLSRDRGLDLSAASSSTEFAQLLTDALQSIRRSEIAIHGRRIQEMFAYVVASLGNTALIKAEDAGEIISSRERLVAPDYRVVLLDNAQLLIEVKNSHSANPKEPVRLTPQYLSGLREYGVLAGAPVYIAVYWSRWNLWTLAPLDALPSAGLTLLSGTLENHMFLLGDQILGTTPPLLLRIVADPSAPRERDDSGAVTIRIGGVEFYCAGVSITDRGERSLAFQLMLFGEWPESDTDVKLEGKSVVHFDMIFAPEEAAANQPFQVIGILSSIISRRFQLLTTKERQVTALSPAVEPDSLGLLIPKDYSSSTLPLWRLSASPNVRGGA